MMTNFKDQCIKRQREQRWNVLFYSRRLLNRWDVGVQCHRVVILYRTSIVVALSLTGEDCLRNFDIRLSSDRLNISSSFFSSLRNVNIRPRKITIDFVLYGKIGDGSFKAEKWWRMRCFIETREDQRRQASFLFIGSFSFWGWLRVQKYDVTIVVKISANDYEQYRLHPSSCIHLM